MELFGYKFSKSEEIPEDKKVTFSTEQNNDGSIDVDAYVDFAGLNKYILDLDAEFENETQRINAYRNMSRNPDVANAIDDIVNEAIIPSGFDDVLDLNLNNCKFTDQVKEKISKEFTNVLSLMNFNNEGEDIFRRWYIDGKLYYHKVTGPSEKDGIIEVRSLDPRRIKKVRETLKDNRGIKTLDKREYYVYSLSDPDKLNKSLVVSGTEAALEIQTDMIAYSHSGLVVEGTSIVESYLQKALKPLNQLVNLEDSVVVYRISRAPERRIFYIDVGNLQKTRAEQYMKSIIAKYKNKTVYDATTGTFTNNKNHVSMSEDIWLPRKDGQRGTQVDTLSGAASLGELDDVLYFKNKLLKSLHIPASRQESDSTFNMGRSSEITRDELKFNKFIKKLQRQFGEIVLDILKTQLILKKIITNSDWSENKYEISLIFNTDSYYTELKESEILRGRIEMLDSVSEHIGRFFTIKQVQTNILRMTEDDIKEFDKQKKLEISSGILPDPSKEQEE